jgi:hypothetical protein
MSDEHWASPYTNMSGEQRPVLAQQSRARVVLSGVAACLVLLWLAVHNPSAPTDRGARGSDASVRAQGGMSCGGAAICGVVTLESGLGSGYYRHPTPSVHGLWPQVPPYGDSRCVAPSSGAPRKPGLPTCYREAAINPDQQVEFVEHEWNKHGRCAGAASEDDYFAQVCALSAPPVKLMRAVRDIGGDLQAMVVAVRTAGYPIYQVDGMNAQILLSACATAVGQGYKWQLAAVSEFGAVCGGLAGRDAPPRAPAATQSCVPSVKGPPCTSEADCAGLGGCRRCARSGFCTDVP